MSASSGGQGAAALRARTVGKVVVLQIDDRLRGRVAGSDSPVDEPEGPFDDTVAGVSTLCCFRFTQERDAYEYVFIEAPPVVEGRMFRDVDGERSLCAFWAKPYALAVALRAMPEARWFLMLDTDAFLGVTSRPERIEELIEEAERLDRHLVLQAVRKTGRHPGDFWGASLGRIVPPVYAEPQAFNSGAILVRQSARGRQFVECWLGLTSEAAGPSPLEQRMTTLEVRATLASADSWAVSCTDWAAVVADSIREARRRGAPLEEEHEVAVVSSTPAHYREIEPSKVISSATFDSEAQSLNFDLRCVRTHDELWPLVEWISGQGCAGPFSDVLRCSLLAATPSVVAKVTSVETSLKQDLTGEYLLEWPGDQERLSWAFTLRPEDVHAIPWTGRGGALQDLKGSPGLSASGATEFAECEAAVWHPCVSVRAKIRAASWVSEVLLGKYGRSELSLLQLPVLKPPWGNVTAGGRECTFEALCDRIDDGRFQFWEAEIA